MSSNYMALSQRENTNLDLGKECNKNILLSRLFPKNKWYEEFSFEQLYMIIIKIREDISQKSNFIYF